MHYPRLLLLTPMLFGYSTLPAKGNSCEALNEQASQRITMYVKKLARLPENADLTLISSVIKDNTCYRTLQFAVAGQNSRFTLLLSPDQRFLASQIYDSQVDPIQAEAEQEKRWKDQINSYIAAHGTPLLGRPDAPVTIAVFSDFQCPFCKKAMELLTKEFPATANQQVRVAYFHYPLPSHSWAKPAAEAAECVASQSNSAFWEMDHFLFDHQTELDASRLAPAITDQLQRSSRKDIDLASFQACLDLKKTARRVEDDIAFGESLNISATPTLFINGKRLVGVETADQIWQAVSQKAESKP